MTIKTWVYFFSFGESRCSTNAGLSSVRWELMANIVGNLVNTDAGAFRAQRGAVVN